MKKPRLFDQLLAGERGGEGGGTKLGFQNCPYKGTAHTYRCYVRKFYSKLRKGNLNPKTLEKASLSLEVENEAKLENIDDKEEANSGLIGKLEPDVPALICESTLAIRIGHTLHTKKGSAR